MQLPYEYRVMKNLAVESPIGIPKAKYMAQEANFNVMVMDLLGPSLADLFNFCNKKFELKTVLMLAD